jgi:hypothetical protein
MLADRSGDKKLNKEEFQAFLHPEVSSRLFFHPGMSSRLFFIQS